MKTLQVPNSITRLEAAIPPVPVLFGRLRKVLADPDCSMDELAKLIEREPATAARVLRIANSARYATRSQVCSIRHAVMVLGVRAVENLVLEAGLVRAFAHLAEDFHVDSYWGHAVRTAIGCRELAALSPEAPIDPEQAYATGLLHDVGQIALANADPSTYGEVIDASEGEEDMLITAEKEAFGVDHAMFGAWILRTWELPESLAEAVERHHLPELWDETSHLERLVRMHDAFDEAFQRGGGDEALATRDNELMLLLNVTPDTFGRHLEALVDEAENFEPLQ